MTEKGPNNYLDRSGEPFWRNEARRIAMAANDTDVQMVLGELHEGIEIAKSSPAGYHKVSGLMIRLDMALEAAAMQFDLEGRTYRDRILKEAEKVFWEKRK